MDTSTVDELIERVVANDPEAAAQRRSEAVRILHDEFGFSYEQVAAKLRLKGVELSRERLRQLAGEIKR